LEDDPAADSLLLRLKPLGYHALKRVLIERVFRLENITEAQADQLFPLLSNPVAERLSPDSMLRPEDGPVFEVGYQRAVTDPELPSILRGARSLGVSTLSWARISLRYQFSGLGEEQAREIVSRYLYNPQVQVLIGKEDKWDSLRPRGETGPVECIALKNLDSGKLMAMSNARRLFLDPDQMKALQKIADSMNRSLTDAELEMFAQTWSDHCFHTTWKSLGLLKMLQDATRDIHHPLVVSMFEDNAGVMEFYDGWALTLKGETHNSPTAVSPYGGIMTKHGGVIRDTLGCGQGAWPIGGSTVMGIGDPRMPWEEVPEGALHPRTILLDSIRGTADYCNPMGIPMMFPVYRFHKGYIGKCFALGHSVGLIPKNRASKGRPLPGDIIVLIGGHTGRDGLHGATVSSSSMTHDTAVVDAAHVQIGHPIQERKFMEAIPVLRDEDCLRAVTDLGAAGLSSAAGEMGADTGLWINLARVQLKTEGMHPWEIWISESQERMLLCVPPQKIKKAMEILDRFEVPASIIGKFTETHRCQVIYDQVQNDDITALPVSPALSGECVVDLDFENLRKGCPLPRLTCRRSVKTVSKFGPGDLKTPQSIRSAVNRLLSHLNCCDQSAAGTQFDSTIQGNTVSGPFGGKDGRMPNDYWASAPVRGKPYGVLAAVAFNPFYGDIDASGLTKLMIFEAITKLAGAGVSYREIVLCDNFYTPRVTGKVAYDLTEMVRTCCELSRILGTPFISGKDSSSGTFIGRQKERIDMPLTLSVMALGRIRDVRLLSSKPFKTPGNRIYLLGPVTDSLGGSVYMDCLGERGFNLPNPSPEDLIRLFERLPEVRKIIRIQAVSALGEGGLMRRLFEMALGSGLGCQLSLDRLIAALPSLRTDTALFAEMIGTIIIEVPPEHGSRIEELLPAILLGSVIQEREISLEWGKNKLDLCMQDLVRIWEQPFREVAR
jgi:phosphoribosylformylglycinamidine synthase II